MSPHLFMSAAALVAALAAAAGGYLARGTTAVPAAAWATVAALALAFEATGIARGWLVEPASRAAVRLVVAALAVCPAMSILGAKRPQHGVWQFIVATLAAVLAMPAVTAVLVRPGSMPDLHLIEQCFLPLLVIVGWLNYVATRRSLAVSLVSAGQLALLWQFLPMVGQGEPLAPKYEAIATACVAAGGLLAVIQAVLWPVTRKRVGGAFAGIEIPVLVLRETLGAAWTLRVAERFNAVAVERMWPCRLQFRGLALESSAPLDGWERDARRCIRSLLRRFVSAAWLERHGSSDHDVVRSADFG